MLRSVKEGRPELWKVARDHDKMAHARRRMLDESRAWAQAEEARQEERRRRALTGLVTGLQCAASLSLEPLQPRQQ